MTFLDGVAGGIVRRDIALEHEVEQDGQADGRHDDELLARALHASRGDRGAAGGQVREHDPGAGALDQGFEVFGDVVDGEVAVRHRREDVAAAGDLIDGRDHTGREVAVTRDDGAYGRITHRLPGD